MTPPSVDPIHVIVADDQVMVREALATLLSLEPDIVVVGQAGNGADTLALLDKRRLQPSEPSIDVVLLDIEMPQLDGLTTCSAIRDRFPSTRVLILTTFGRPGYVQRALDAGASGFLVKDAPSQQLADAVRRIAQGLRVIDPTLAVEALTRGASPLTDREAEVLRSVGSGGTIADVAQDLGLSQGTVRNHVSAAMLKTGARTRSEAVRIATESGWL
ncbi:response regulator transcription factor [Schaalia sp. ZJ405]|uniref:response regulator transcription factor n=1 Tax=Schaalia sp. ZJ405 TaxID=2709403 RepID=UPI0013EA4934|nr:response regulator transcription factor [Schaalia sp. ZJ405]QPK81465.1 response regulator transcription factor [Schaalia sp. ZJ405]